MKQNGHVNGTGRVVQPNPEVQAKPTRRTFNAEYKQRILAEAAGSSEPGAIGALLRREGLYSSHLTTWRRQQEAGELGASRKRGPKAGKQSQELTRLRQQNDYLSRQLEQAGLIIDAQKKLAQIFESALSLNKAGPL